MPTINLNLDGAQAARTLDLARRLKLNRSAYIRRAIDEFNAKVERELLAEQFRRASLKCREESLKVCHEFEALDEGLEDV